MEGRKSLRIMEIMDIMDLIPFILSDLKKAQVQKGSKRNQETKPGSRYSRRTKPKVPILTRFQAISSRPGVETSFIGLKCWLGFFLLPEADKEGKETPSGRLSVTWRKGQELLNKQLKDSLEGSSEVVCTWVKVQKRSKWRQC
ncbi:hypothetical protein Tco_0233469 [Tanacetum coccineum]